MKKKIVSLCLVIALLATAITGATLAYFTDTDAQENVFVTGNVEIDLFEDFGDNDGIEKLLPSNGDDGNEIEKEVYVENTGSEKSYVRVHIAVPSVLNDGTAGDEDKLHMQFNNAWNWTVSDETGADPNEYTTNITNDEGKEIEYTVYVGTYMTALEKGDVTPDALQMVWMDKDVEQADITALVAELGNSWKIYVVAEGGQIDGFTGETDTAITALNAQFGDPAAATYDAPEFTATPESKQWVDGEAEELYNTDGTVKADDLKASAVLKEGLAAAEINVEGNTVTFELDGATVTKTKNPVNQEAYWLGYVDFTVPEYGDAAKAQFNRNGETKSFDVCKDTATTMQAWVGADEADKDAHMTWTFDWDGDGIFEAVYTLHATNLTLVD